MSIWMVAICSVVIATRIGKGSTTDRQYFKVKPTSTNTTEGEEIELFCEVANQAGLVQWTKDGFLLGFDPDIPGYPRLSMAVDVVRSSYNLIIKNVRIEDEGEYQCQVGPAPGQPPIRASAKLIVQVPPRNVTLNDNADITRVIETKSAGKVVLTCTSYQSKPAGRIRWFRKNVELLPEAAKTKVERTNGRVFNTHSTITLFPKTDDNGTVYSCEVLHPALNKPLRRSAIISILTPPNAPQIAGYRDGEPLQIGDTLTLTCTSKGGNPPARLMWLRNGIVVDDTFTTKGREVTNTFTFTLQATDNNANYQCNAESPVLDNPLSSSVKLNVLYPPERVRITGPTEAKKGEIVVMSCSSSPSNPTVKLSWAVDGVPVPSSEVTSETVGHGWLTTSTLSITLSRQDPDLKTFSCYGESPVRYKMVTDTVKLNVLYPPLPPTIVGYREGDPVQEGDIQRLTCVSAGGNPPAKIHWFRNEHEIKTSSSTTENGVSSELVLRVEASDNGAVYRCQVRSPAMTESLEVTVTLNVLFPPENVTIIQQPPNVREGQQVSLLCETSPSNPAAQLTWWRNGSLISDPHQQVTATPAGSFVIRSEISINITSKDDGDILICEVRNPVWLRSIRSEIALTILYRPEFAVAYTDVNIVEGETWKVELSVRANPQINFYKWTKGSTLIPALPASTDIAPRQDGVESLYRVYFEETALHLRKVLRQDAGTYVCEVENDEGSSNATVTVNVFYAATVTSITTSVTCIEGDDAYLECFVDANPLTPDMISWNREGFNFSRARITQDRTRSSFTILNVTKDDAGEYECVAFNGLGSKASKTATLLVLFHPIVIWSAMKTKVAAPEGASVELECIAEGFPNVTFVWSSGESVVAGSFNNTGLEAHTRQVGTVRWCSTLFIRHVSSEHYGYYSCVARNELGFEIGKVKLVRRSVPEPPTNLEVLNVTNSSVHIRWTAGFSGGLEQLFRVQYKQLGSNSVPIHMLLKETECWVKNLDPAKEYLFSVSAINDLGESLASQDVVRVSTQKTTGAMDLTAVDSPSDSSKEDAQFSLIIGCIFGAAFATINACIVGFICQKRYRESRMNAEKKDGSKEQSISISESSAISKSQDELEAKTYLLLEAATSLQKAYDADVLDMKSFAGSHELQRAEKCLRPIGGVCTCPGGEMACEGRLTDSAESCKDNFADDRPDIIKRTCSPWKSVQVHFEALPLEGSAHSVALQEEELLQELAATQHDRFEGTRGATTCGVLPTVVECIPWPNPSDSSVLGEAEESTCNSPNPSASALQDVSL